MADDKPRKPAKSTNLNIRITPELRAAIERSAKAEDRSVSQWVARALGRVLAGGLSADAELVRLRALLAAAGVDPDAKPEGGTK